MLDTFFEFPYYLGLLCYDMLRFGKFLFKYTHASRGCVVVLRAYSFGLAAMLSPG